MKSILFFFPNSVSWSPLLKLKLNINNQTACLITVQNSSKLICGWILMRETTADALFHWGRVIMDYKLYVFELKTS